MAFYQGLSHITNGLQIMLDAGNTASYPGTGTTWTDLSGNGNNASIVASAYKSVNSGSATVKYMDFSGSNGIAKFASDRTFTSDYTVIVWTRLIHTTTDWRTLMRAYANDHQVIVQSDHKLGMYDNKNGSGFNSSGFSVQDLVGYPVVSNVPSSRTTKMDNWVMMVFQFSASSPYYQFKVGNNPNVLGSNTSANAGFKAGIGSIGGYHGGSTDPAASNSQYWGDIAVFMAYTRTLTQAEINQNYDAFAPRFNGGTDASADTSTRYINVFPGVFTPPTSASLGSNLYTDGYNSYWGYPGRQTANLVRYPYAGYAGQSNGVGSFQLSANYDQSGGASMTYVTNVTNPVNAPGIMRYYTGTTGYKYWAINVPVVDAGTYTFSYWARLSAGSTSSNLGNNQLWRDNGTDRAMSGSPNPTFTDQWQRFTITSTIAAGSLNMYVIHSGTLTGGITVDFCGFQLESGSVATNFVPSTMVGDNFQFRTILTHGYLAGGYKGSCPWRALNRTWHATDITMYCGEQLSYAANYIEGTFSDLNGYIHNAADAYATTNSGTQSYSLANGTMRTRGGGTYSPAGARDGAGFPTGTGTSGVGGWNMSVARIYQGCAVDQMGQQGYITGGGSAVTEKLHFASEIMYTTTSNPSGTGFTSGCHGQLKGYFTIAGGKQAITWSNDTWAAYSASVSTDGWCKIMSTKLGYHYAGSGSNVTSGIAKFSDSTGTDISTSMTKVRACGEENLQMGQNWGYMLGNYDGQQNNQTVKYNYLTDTLTQLGTAAQPKGHYGQSSAACSSAAASVASAGAALGY